MRAGHLPSAVDLKQALEETRKVKIEEAEATLLKAARVAGLLLGRCVTPTRKERRLTLNPGYNLMPDWPIRDLTINGHSERVDLIGELGVIYHELAQDEYLVEYEAGWRPGTIPAVIRSLVMSLSCYLLTKEDGFREESTDLLNVARAEKRAQIEERDDYQTHRED